MRIACVTTSSIPSTTANSIQVMKTCNALASLGHEVRVWFPGNAQVSWSEVASVYALTEPFVITAKRSSPAMKRYDFSWRSAVEAKRWTADLFYTWMIPAGRAAQVLRLPVVLELHDRLMGRLGPVLFKQIIRGGGIWRIAVITRALQQVIEEQTGCSFLPDDVVIAPNGVDVERFGNQPSPDVARRSLGLEDKITAVFSGHLYPGRGIGLLAELARRRKDVQFLWVGGKADDVDRWRSYLQQQSIQNVILTGFMDNTRLPDYLAVGDILLMPYERVITGSSGGDTAGICSPMKMFEYMASGRAILTSDLPVIREVLNDEMAFFAPPGDMDAWERALVRLIQDPGLRERLGSAASKAASQYSWKRRQGLILRGILNEISSTQRKGMK